MKRYRFQHAIDPQPSIEIDAWDQRVAESPSFIAIPTRGSIVPGWVLILPRRRAISMAALSDEEHIEFFQFRKDVSQLISSEFGPPTIFEHGAGFSGSLVGCGVDHAHVHLVPLCFDLIEAARNDEGSTIKWQEISDEKWMYSLLRPGENYMSISSPTGRTVYSTGFVPISQYLRKLIAIHVGVPDGWDYRSNSFKWNVLNTLAILKGA